MFSKLLDWKFLPDLILEEIFCYLSWRDRLNASCTCIPWNQTFYSPCLWKKYTYIPPTYLETYSQRIYYDIATYNLSVCFKNVGYSFQSLTIPPTSDFFILNRSLIVISDFYYKQYKRYNITDEVNPLCDYRSKLEDFSFEFDSQFENGIAYGTGGALLASIKRLLDIISNLKSVRLKSLLLTADDRTGLLDEFVKNNRETLTRLSLIDISKTVMPEFEVLNFSNLTELELSSFQLSPDLLVSLVHETKVDTLILTQTLFTLFTEEIASIEPVSSYVWELVNELNPSLKVYQHYSFNNISEFINLNSISIIFQPKPAPITRFSFSSNNTSLLDLNRLTQYQQTLTEIIIIVDSATNSAIRSSIDEDLLLLVDSNRSLTSLVLGGERLSVHSSTLLYLVSEMSQNLKHLFVQSNAVQYRMDTVSMSIFHSSLSDDLIATSSNRDRFRSAVAAHLKVPKWNLLTEQQFIRCIDKHGYAV